MNERKDALVVHSVTGRASSRFGAWLDDEQHVHGSFATVVGAPPRLVADVSGPDAMLEDLAAYESHAAHFGAPPI